MIVVTSQGQHTRLVLTILSLWPVWSCRSSEMYWGRISLRHLIHYPHFKKSDMRQGCVSWALIFDFMGRISPSNLRLATQNRPIPMELETCGDSCLFKQPSVILNSKHDHCNWACECDWAAGVCTRNMLEILVQTVAKNSKQCTEHFCFEDFQMCLLWYVWTHFPSRSCWLHVE